MQEAQSPFTGLADQSSLCPIPGKPSCAGELTSQQEASERSGRCSRGQATREASCTSFLTK